jgi:hypothetical protein
MAIYCPERIVLAKHASQRAYYQKTKAYHAKKYREWRLLHWEETKERNRKWMSDERARKKFWAAIDAAKDLLAIDYGRTNLF